VVSRAQANSVTSKFLSHLKTLFRRGRLKDDVSEELQFHLQNQIEKNIAAGMTPEEARYAALRSFGGVDQIKEQCRDVRPLRFGDEFCQDARYAWRMLRKSPGFTTVAVLTLALGIGTTTAVFGLVDSVLLRMLPVKDPEQLVVFANVGGLNTPFSYPHYRQLRDQSQSFEGVIAFESTELDSAIDGKPERVQGQFVSGNYFSVLGVGTALGRPLADEDDRVPGGHPVAVISAGYWQRRFGGDPSALGKTITLQSYPFTIVGVLPREFFGLEVGNSPDITVPMMMKPQLTPKPSYLTDPGIGWLQIAARTKPGITRSEAQANALVIYQRLKEDTLKSLPPGIPPQLKQMISETRLELQSASQGLNHLRSRFSRPLLILISAAGMMLLIVCSNVANLMLARSTTRRREFAVRLAIGAGRSRLIQQLFTESLLLATLGGLVGLFLALSISRLLLVLVSSGHSPVFLNLNLDYRLLGFTAIVALTTTLVFGLMPALRATKVSLNDALKQGSERSDGVRSTTRSGKLLVVLQVALSTVLLIGAGLLFRTLRNLRNVDAGFNHHNVLLFSLSPSSASYPQGRLTTLYDQLLGQLTAIPGVLSASSSQFSPAGGNYWMNVVSLDGYVPRLNEDMQVEVNLISPGFFKTLSIPLLAGRSFIPQDNENSPKVAIINETMARRYFANVSPIGQRMGFGPVENSGQIEIVGLAKNVTYGHLRHLSRPMVYVPYPQEMLSEMTFAVRSQSNPLALVPQIQQQLQAIDKNLPLLKVKTLNTQIEESLVQERMIGTLLDSAAMFGFLIACLGLYGLLSYSVASRTNEIGIRMALGAKSLDVRRLILRQGMILTLLGVSIGLIASVGLSRFLSSLLYGVSGVDPVTYVVLSVVFFLVASISCYIPAVRATRVDPMVALRYE
jgi:predicted permease